jgi:glycosyltransferase 2 family protein
MPRASRRDALRNTIRLTIGIAVSLACLWFATRGTDWDAVGHVLGSARMTWVLASALSSLLAILLRAQRWRLLLRPVAAVPLAPAFSATAIGFAATSVLPLRLGEVIRPAVLARRVGFAISPALSSVVLERLFDLLFVLLCFLVLSVIYPLPAELRRAALVLGTAAVAGFVVLLVASRNRPRAERILEAVLAWVPAAVGRVVRPLATGFLDALGALGSVRIVGGVVGYSALLWSANALPFLFGLLALGIAVPLVSAALACVVVVAAFVFMPQAPGFLGTWQAGCVVALDLFGVPKDLAVGFSLLTWVIQMLVNVPLGGYFASREDVSLRQLVRGGAPAPAAEGGS